MNAIAAFNGAQFIAVGDNGAIVVSQPPRIGPFVRGNDGSFQFSLTGLSGSTAIADVATTLSPPNWQPMATNTIVNGSAAFSDYIPGQVKFYRVRLQ